MQIHLTGRHCDFVPSLQQLTQQKMDKLQRYARDILEAQVVLTREKSRHVAEITIRLKSQKLVSSETSTDAAEAISMAAERIEESLRRLKEKRVDRHQRHEGARGLNGRAANGADDSGDDLE